MKINFTSLINIFKKEINIIRNDTGTIVDGEYIPGTETYEKTYGALFPITAKDFEDYQGLNFTPRDFKVYLPISQPQMKRQDTFEIENVKYEVLDINDRVINSDFVIYFAKKVVVT